MSKLTKLLLATVLTAAAYLSVPPKASASTACDVCNATLDCYYCCRCQGFGAGPCTIRCGG